MKSTDIKGSTFSEKSKKYILIADGKFIAWGSKTHLTKHIDRNPQWKVITLKMVLYDANNVMIENVTYP